MGTGRQLSPTLWVCGPAPRRGPQTSCGDLCTFAKLEDMRCTECDESLLGKWETATKKLAEKIGVRERTDRDLLRDYMLTTLSRWSQDAEKPREHLARVMHELATNAE